MTQPLPKPLSTAWLWLVPALMLAAMTVVSVGGYTDVASRIVPFEEVAPKSLHEASAAIQKLGGEGAVYRRWQVVDALFIALQMGIFLLVATVAASGRPRYRRAVPIATAAGCIVLGVGEAMENAAILGLLDGYDRLDLLRLGLATKWAVFPCLALGTLVLLGGLAIRGLRARGLGLAYLNSWFRIPD